MALAAGGRPPLHVGVVLLLGRARGLDESRFLSTLARRVAAVPRLRQRLLRPPPGCGRSYWADDPAYRFERHVRSSHRGAPLDEAGVLAEAAALLTVPLPRDRPLWRAVVLTGGGDLAAVVLVAHHVLVDGLAGLAVLAALADGDHARPAEPAFPRPAPAFRVLALDAARERLAQLRRLPVAVGRLSAATGQLRPVLTARAVRCSLNRPTGPERVCATAAVALETVLAFARAHDATVNDVLLTVVAGSLRRLLLARGEAVDAFVLSVPVAARTGGAPLGPGNHSGVVPLLVPARGPLAVRLARTAARSRAAKDGVRGASTALLAPAFRLLSVVGAYRWFIRHQRRVHTFVSDVRGPARTLTLDGHPVVRLVPLSVAPGNVTLSFTALSYAGELVVAVMADPRRVPDLERIRDEVQADLDGLRPEDA